MKLSPLTKENCEEARQWRNENIAAWRTPFLLTEEMQEDFYRDVVCNRNPPHRYWAIWDEESTNQLVGMGGVTNIQWENQLTEISLVIRPSFQGMGHGQKAVELLLDQAFNYLGLQTVFGECYYTTDAVDFWQGIAEKYNGFTTNLPDRKYWDGEFYSSLYFSIDANDFRKVHSPV